MYVLILIICAYNDFSVELQLNSDHKPCLFYKKWEQLLVLYTDCNYDATKSGLNSIRIRT